MKCGIVAGSAGIPVHGTLCSHLCERGGTGAGSGGRGGSGGEKSVRITSPKRK